jgi:hypothetical protein
MRAPRRGHMTPSRAHPAEKSAHQPQDSVRGPLIKGEPYRSPCSSRRYEDTPSSASADSNTARSGSLAAAVLHVRGRLPSRERSGLGAAACGKPLVQAARANASAVPDLRIQNRAAM